MEYFKEHVDQMAKEMDEARKNAEKAYKCDREIIIERLGKISDFHDAIMKRQSANVVEECIRLMQSVTLNELEYTMIKKALDYSYTRFRGDNIPKKDVDNFLEEFNDHFGREPDNIDFIKESEMVM